MESKLEFVPFDGYIATLHTGSIPENYQPDITKYDCELLEKLIKEVGIIKLKLATSNMIAKM